MSPISPAAGYAPRPSGKATASLVLGIVGLVGSVTAIPSMLAVIYGHLAADETSNGRRSGHGQAVAGLALGYVVVVPLGIALSVLAWVGLWQMVRGG